jgi:hypothetical protein
MGLVLEFPADATMRRLGETAGGVMQGGAAKILILPVVRVERHRDPDDQRRPQEAGGEASNKPRQRPSA